MKRTINFFKDEKNYIFKENEENQIKIDINDKVLNGLDLYNAFFKNYDINDSFVINDCTTDKTKKEDKMCKAIFDKVKELITNIENTIRTELSSNNIEKE